ncbi:hypothetical protein [Haloprofundus salinisoli]|uniref:hypothetical protein n=1 Tax=Haloprofundus salinisoli TaxID=2876193 RepID=UPI001CCE2CFF|nr:hypothetical protein [Haloprofundus salinisoli]
MPDRWLALRRVGEWAGLESDQLTNYLATARPVHNQALQARKEESSKSDLRAEYFDFLNEAVFPAEPIVSFLQQNQIDNQIVKRFETGSVPVKDAFRALSVIDYGLDEIVDFVMLLKLLEQYQERAEIAVEPLENLHSLAYLVNYRLSESDSYAVSDDHGFGMLEKTGFRYTFERRGDYVWSDSLQRDQDRLAAWQILDRETIDDPQPEWDITYSVSLGEAAELFLTRFEKRLNNFDSFLLNEWEIQQNTVLEDFATSSKAGISSHLESLERFSTCGDGKVVLNGRPKKFKSERDQKKSQINV